MNAIEIKGLTKQYNDFMLGPFDLTLPMAVCWAWWGRTVRAKVPPSV